jgi:hypothetical protein
MNYDGNATAGMVASEQSETVHQSVERPYPENTAASERQVNPLIPSNINSWDKVCIVKYYLDELRWNLTPLKPQSKDSLYAGDKRYEVSREDLLTHLGNGCNFGLFPAGTHVVLDLDSKGDSGKSVEKFLEKAGPRVQSLPRERTAGGVHIHLRIKDLDSIKRQFPTARKLINKRVAHGVAGEMFFGATGYVVVSPSMHELGIRYQWETFGEIAEWSWREFTSAFGDFDAGKIAKPMDEKTRARKFSGDLTTLNIVKLVEELGWYQGPDSKRDDTHVITCPWNSEHTDGKTTASVFVAANGRWPGFNCFHAHCERRGLLDFLEKGEEQKPSIVDSHCAEKWEFEKGTLDAEGRVKVLLPAEGIQMKDEFVCEIAEALKPKQVWFTHNAQVVRVETEEKSRINAQGKLMKWQEQSLRSVTPAESQSLLGLYVCTRHLRTVELPNGGEKATFLKKSMDSADASMLMVSPLLLQTLPKIDRLTSVPVPVSVGEVGQWVLPRSGYNSELRMWVDQGLKLRAMPLEEAKTLIGGHLERLSFCR